MPEERLTDIDAELREMLTVEPSAEFAARVRQRVATERMRGGSWRPVWAWAATATAAAILLGVIALKPSTGVSVPPPTPVVSVVAPAVSPSLVAHVSPVDVRRVAPRTIQRVVASHEPEVLVDPRQRAAIGRLLLLARGLPESREPDPMVSAAVLEDLVVPTVIVEPLEVPALPTGGGAPEINGGRR